MSPGRFIAIHYKNETPLLRMLIPFMTGIVIQLFFPIGVGIPALVLIFSTVSLVFQTFIKRFSSDYSIRVAAGILLSAAFFSLGILLTDMHKEHRYPEHFQNQHFGQSLYIGRLTKPLSDKTGTYKSIIEVIAIGNHSAWKEASGKVLTYLKKDDHSCKLKYGDLICFLVPPVPVSLPQNPGEFNYKRFLAFHQVYHQVYLAPENWCRLPGNDGNSIIRAANQVRDLFISLLKKQIPWNREYSVASALIIGFEEDVDQELINAYSSAGALHILSVSGMHVGLIYQGLIILLGFMNRKRWSSHLLYSFLVCFIWFYAFITGFSPSVARSALMLSIVIIAKWQRVNSNVFNTLVVTAFGLLIYNPSYLTEVGFQLSFMAVWGIIYFHPKIYMLLEPSGRILHWIWELTSISVSAQLMTFPLGLLYFHQFPNLFMLSNLVVIPLSGIIIYLCIGVLIFWPIPWLGGWIAWLSTWMLWILNQCVLSIERIPFAVIGGISISVFETWLTYLLLVTVTLFLSTRKSIYLCYNLLLLIFINGSQLYEKYAFVNLKKMIVYNIPKMHAIDFICGDKHVFLADESLLSNKGSLLFHIVHNWWNTGMKSDSTCSWENYFNNATIAGKTVSISKNFLFIMNKRICIANPAFISVCRNYKLKQTHRIKVDYLLMADPAAWNIKDIQKLVDCKLVIIDSSVSRKKAEKWIRECRVLGLPCYSVMHQGAFVCDLH